MMQIDFSTLTLTPIPRCRARDPITSRVAARFALSGKAAQERAAIVDTLRCYGPRTAWELSWLMVRDYVGIQRRLSECQGIHRTGERKDGMMVWAVDA